MGPKRSFPERWGESQWLQVVYSLRRERIFEGYKMSNKESVNKCLLKVGAIVTNAHFVACRHWKYISYSRRAPWVFMFIRKSRIQDCKKRIREQNKRAFSLGYHERSEFRKSLLLNKDHTHPLCLILDHKLWRRNCMCWSNKNNSLKIKLEKRHEWSIIHRFFSWMLWFNFLTNIDFFIP